MNLIKEQEERTLKTLYEGMFILPKSINEDALDGALATIGQEIATLGGAVKNTTKLGKRHFARPMGKQNSGYYFIIDFDFDGTQIDALLARFKLGNVVFRVQITKKSDIAIAAQEAAKVA